MRPPVFVQAEVRTVDATVTATGTLNPVVTVQVGSQVSGNIAKLFVDFNSPVKAGQVVAQIDPALFQATVTQTEGDVANAQATLELAKVNAKRTQELFAKKTSSQADVDQATATLHQSEANVKIKQGALDKVRTDLEHCTITSPIDGVVISRSVDVGQTVAASLQAPIIFAIANDLTKMQIDANVSSSFYGNPDKTKNEGTFRDAAVALGLEQKLGRSPFLTNASDQNEITMSFSGRYERLQENRHIPGKKADIAVANWKLEIPVAAGISLPLSVTYANATELIKEKHVRGNFGITVDLDKLKALAGAK